MSAESAAARAQTIYFAGSIRGGRGDRVLYATVIELLRGYGRVLTEHIAEESLTERGENLSDVEIHDRDVEWLRSATHMVAEVSTPSLGVGYEIGRAVEWGIPILCLFREGEDRKLSAMISGCAEVRMREYRSASDLPRLLSEFFPG